MKVVVPCAMMVLSAAFAMSAEACSERFSKYIKRACNVFIRFNNMRNFQ